MPIAAAVGPIDVSPAAERRQVGSGRIGEDHVDGRHFVEGACSFVDMPRLVAR